MVGLLLGIWPGIGLGVGLVWFGTCWVAHRIRLRRAKLR